MILRQNPLSVFKKSLQNNNRYLFLILLIAFLIRLIYVLLIPNATPYWDDHCYDAIANNVALGKGFVLYDGQPDTTWFPLVIYFYASVYWLFGHSHIAAMIAQSVIGVITCFLIYHLSTKIYDNKIVSLIAVTISAFYPFLVYFNGSFSTHTLYTFLLLILVINLTSLSQNHLIIKSIYIGLLIGLLILTRDPSIGLIPFIIGWIFYKSYKDKQQALLATCTMLIVMSIVLAPWYIRTYKIHGQFSFTPTVNRHGGLNLWWGNNSLSAGGTKNEDKIVEVYDKLELKFSGLSEVEKNKMYFKLAFGFIKENPIRFLELCSIRFKIFWGLTPRAIPTENVPNTPYGALKYKLISIFSYGILLPFFVIGLIFSVKYWRNTLPSYLIILFTTTLHTVVRSSIAYRVAIAPYIIMFGAFGIYLVWLRIRHRNTRI